MDRDERRAGTRLTRLARKGWAAPRVRAVPLGVVAAITPWNAPLISSAWKLCPALMAGNSVLWKPSSLATASASRLGEMVAATAIPNGTVQLVAGSGEVGAALAADHRVDAIHFTGSTGVGRRIAAAAGGRLARCALELGGSNPAIVLADADLGAAAAAISESMLAVNGQKCTATRRVIVQDDVFDELVERLRDLVEAAVPGDPADPQTAIGPLITPNACRDASRVIGRATHAGATVLARAASGEGVGAFSPTVLGGLPPQEALRREELFAPVVIVDSVADEDEGVALANATRYGLSAAIHTTDPGRGRRIAESVEAGVIGLNRRTDAVELRTPLRGPQTVGERHPRGRHVRVRGSCRATGDVRVRGDR